MVSLEGFVPYDRSVRWTIQDAYYAARGIKAWRGGDIPFLATSNYPIASQHATLVAGVVEALTRRKVLGAGQSVVVLEIGSGNGQFAANFFRALGESRRRASRALRSRILYVLSDFRINGLREAVSHPTLKRFVQSDQLIPALFDVRQPAELRDTAGRRLQLTYTAVIANYVCGTTPVKVLWKDGKSFLEKHISVSLIGRDGDMPARQALDSVLARSAEGNLQRSLSVAEQWRTVELKSALSKPIHAQTVRASVRAYESATVPYPLAFLDALLHLSSRMTPGGLFLVTDFGSSRLDSLRGRRQVAPTLYGNSLAHGVQFPVLETFARRAGWDVVRTGVETDAVHTLCIRTIRQAPRSFHESFRAGYIDRSDGHDLLDSWWAGQEARHQRDFSRAARFFRHCVRLDANNPEILYYLGEACLEAGSVADAAHYLERGRKLDETTEFDFDFQLARVYHRQGRRRESIARYRRSLVREQHPVTYANLGILYLECGQHAAADRALRKSLELDPQNARAQRGLARLKTARSVVEL